MKWQKELLKLWDKRSDKQEKEGDDVIVDFDELMIDVEKIFKKEIKLNHISGTICCEGCYRIGLEVGRELTAKEIFEDIEKRNLIKDSCKNILYPELKEKYTK